MHWQWASLPADSRSKILAGLKKSWDRASSPERLKKNSETMKACWADPHLREKLLAGAAKKRGKRQPQDVVARRNETVRKLYRDHPERKAFLIQNGKKLAASPYHHRRKPGEVSWSAETRRRISQGVKARIDADPKLKEIYLEALAKGRERMRLRTSPTRPERAMAKMLQDLGEPFEVEFKLGAYFIDLACVEKRLAILVDGCFWHCCPVHFPNATTKQQSHNLIFDYRRDQAILKHGWHVSHIWEHALSNKAKRSQVEKEIKSLCAS